MSLNATLLAILLQVGPNPVAQTPADPTQELRNRPPRETALQAPTDPISAWLSECLELVGTDPARAHTTAQIRRNDTSGPSRVIANHCLGMASTELGLWDDARAAFIAARDETPFDEPRAKARVGIMAGNAALVAGDAAGAAGLFGQARQDAQIAASATLQAAASSDEARALVALGRNEEALAALDMATGLEPQNSESWLLKATLLRRMERLTDAQTAIEQAAQLNPLNGEIGLEAGVIAVLSGREDAARQSWQSVVDTQPDSASAKTASDYLAQIGPAINPQEAAASQ